MSRKAFVLATRLAHQPARLKVIDQWVSDFDIVADSESLVDLYCRLSGSKQDEDTVVIISEWLDEVPNAHEERLDTSPIAVGLTEEQLSDWWTNDIKSWDRLENVLASYNEWAATQTFTKKYSPSWDEAPSWAIWKAQDYNGAWYWFENRPHLDDSVGLRQWHRTDDGLIIHASCNNDCQETLQMRPDAVQASQTWMPKQDGCDVTDAVVVLYVTKQSVLVVDFHNKEHLFNINYLLTHYKK